jgi:hypothetical protein
MKMRHLIALLLVVLAGCSSTPAAPAKKTVQSWTPSKDDRLRVETLVRTFLQGRPIVTAEELSHMIVDVNPEGYLDARQKRIIGCTFVDRRLLPSKEVMEKSAVSFIHDAMVLIIVVDATDWEVVEARLLERVRKGIEQATPPYSEPAARSPQR